uniref:pentapeptide repeat-containing protein n=1 Tax=Mycobacterium paragordonae TaxID=1389713 RepID=UPI0018CC56C3
GNTSVANTGIGNTGSYNTGFGNTGSHNTGSFNAGSFNTGDANPGDRNTGSFNGGSINTGFANSGDLNTGSFNTGSRNVGSFMLADGQVQGTTFTIEFPAIPIDLSAGANTAIPITGHIDPLTVDVPQFNIPLSVRVRALGIITLTFNGPQVGPDLPPIVVNQINLKDLAVGVNVQVPLQMTILGRLNVTFPGMVGVGNSSVSSGYFNGNSSGTSGFFNSSDLSSGFANANGALASGWYNSGSLLSGWQNVGDAISGFANTSIVNGAAIMSGVGNIGSQVSGFWNGQMSALQAGLADWVASR